MKATLVSSSGGDWEGLYKDGSLFTQGHEVTTRDICRCFDLEIETKEADEEWLNDLGYLPKSLEEIPKEYLK